MRVVALAGMGILLCVSASAVTRYVDAASGSPAPPYTNWQAAAQTIIAAVGVSGDGDTILVTNGTYSGQFPHIPLTNSIALLSVNGCHATTVSCTTMRGFYLCHTGAVLDGFTVLNGRAAYGGGAFVETGTVRNCVFSECQATNASGGGLYVESGGLVEDTTVSGNRAVNYAGGIYIYNGTVRQCRVSGNTAHSGGGIYVSGGMAESVTLSQNRSDVSAGGAYLYGAVLRNGVAWLNSCTGLAASGGGFCVANGSEAENCTAVGNSAAYGGGIYNSGSTVRNSILRDNTAPLGGPNYNGTASPVIEFSCVPEAQAGAGNITSQPQFVSSGSGNFRLATNSPCRDSGTNMAWTATGTDLDHTPRRVNGRVDMGAYEFQIAHVAPGGGNVVPYDTWAKAATNIQDAVNVVSNHYLVLVSNGNYRMGSELLIAKPITVRSANGRNVTAIDGGGGHRCVRMTTNAWLDGFTVTNGYHGGGFGSGGGAGILCEGVAGIANCRIANNRAYYYGGGVNANEAYLTGCEIVGNVSTGYMGGGVFLFGGTIDGCLVQSNQAKLGGGGVQCYFGGGRIRNCLVLQNVATDEGAGGVDIYNGTWYVESSTLCGNSASASYAGGIEGGGGYGAATNCIVMFNSSGASSNHSSISFTHSCTAPLPGGVGNTEQDPVFANRGAGNYRLATNSPCRNTGTNLSWMSDARDIEGAPRIVEDRTDMGAHELSPVHYVAPGGEHIWPYAVWGEAATNIQAAVDAADARETVLVSNGNYLAASELVVTQTVAITSVNGMDMTSINGGGTHRCVNIATGAVLSGFTLTNGYSSTVGGGAYLAGGGTICSSIIAKCWALEAAGGVYVLSNGMVSSSYLIGNTTVMYNAGAAYLRYGGALSHCTIVSNAAQSGGGVYCDGGGSLTNCLLWGNRARSGDGGGAVFAGGGAAESCTLAGNSASGNGGGAWCSGGGALLNTIVYGNTAAGGSNYYINVAGASFTNCCAAPSVGTACVSNDPQFVRAFAGNFRLGMTSPCVEAAAARGWMAGAADSDGSPRITGAAPDIGAYEFHYTYAATNGGSTAPYDTWATAATGLQAAVDVAGSNGYPVLVSNGIYTAAAELYVGQPILVRSVNGWASTFLQGAGVRRGVHLATNAVFEGFTITNCYAADLGGGAYVDNGGILRSCRVMRCAAAMFGGGVYATRNARIEDCAITRNTANNNLGGGVYLADKAVMDRCVVATNQAPGGGGLCDQGGTTRNCLIVANTANTGGGVYLRGSLYGTVESSTICSNYATVGGGVYDEGGGTVRNCIVYYNRDTNYAAAGSAWQHCCTMPSNGTACVADGPQFAGGGDYRLAFASPCLGAGTNQTWMNGALDLDLGPRLVGTSVDIGAYELGLLHYVRLLGSWTPSSPYSSWSTAATNIQDALNACGRGDMVIVTDGVHVAASQISVTQAVTLASVNGAGMTAIDGGRARRCLQVATNALIYGFTLSNGYASVGGGVYLSGGGTIRDCVLATNFAGTYGGGAFLSGTGVLQNCRLVGNTAMTNDGGAVYFQNGGTLLDCVAVSNSAVKGGALFFDNGGRARNCLVAGNRARGGAQPAWGGGVLFYRGGGLENCTVSDNAGADGGGGIYGDSGGAGYVENSIVFFNTGGANSNYANMPAKYWTNCCTAPSAGAACVAADPRFVDRASGNWRLAWESPCLDAGITGGWMPDGKDLDGDLRIWNGEVDIGAYELPIIHVAASGNSVPPYSTWGDAATNPVDAAAVKRSPCAIWVADGIYPIAAQIFLTGRVTFVSQSGAANTTIRGNGQGRCFDIGYGSCVIDGFTITGGATNLGNGGGVQITRGGTVQNCIIRSNSALSGGGVFCFASGVVQRCVLAANTATHGGGAYLLAGGVVQNCLVYSNVVAGGAGGIYLGYGTGMVRNCTMVRNAAADGGGVYCGPESRVENTIAWFNSASDSGSNHFEAGLDIAYSNCCTAPAIGTGCVSNDPRFANLAACDFRIGTNSPCVDAGLDAASLTNDFDGMMRPLDGNRDGVAAWDIGAYEALNILADTDGNGMPDGWENEHYGWPVSGANPAADEDGDLVVNLDEAIADTDPHIASSFHRITNFINDVEFCTVEFPSSSNRCYTLQATSNLLDGAAWTNVDAHRRGAAPSMRMKSPLGPPSQETRVRAELP